MKTTYENVATAVKEALNSIKGVKLEEIFPYVLLLDFGVTAPEVETLIKKVAENFEFPRDLVEYDISCFFGDRDWKTLTVSIFTDKCFDLLVYKALEDE